MHILIINGYSKEARQKLFGEGMLAPELLFKSLIEAKIPDARLSVIFPDDGPHDLSLSNFNAVIWTGSSSSLVAPSPGVGRQIEIMQALLRHDIPVWGSCWGLQLAAVAGGGTVRIAPAGREWLLACDVALNDEGRAHPMFAGKPNVFDSYAMHLDEVQKIPEGMQVLASNKHSSVQAAIFRRNRCDVWLTQYHPEFTINDMAYLIKSYLPALLAEGHIISKQAGQNLVEHLLELANGSRQGGAIPGFEKELGASLLNKKMVGLEFCNWLDFIAQKKAGRQ
jgi:GMP synthase (glutamine-hydrolysing)